MDEKYELLGDVVQSGIRPLNAEEINKLKGADLGPKQVNAGAQAKIFRPVLEPNATPPLAATSPRGSK